MCSGACDGLVGASYEHYLDAIKSIVGDSLLWLGLVGGVVSGHWQIATSWGHRYSVTLQPWSAFQVSLSDDTVLASVADLILELIWSTYCKSLSAPASGTGLAVSTRLQTGCTYRLCTREAKLAWRASNVAMRNRQMRSLCNR